MKRPEPVSMRQRRATQITHIGSDCGHDCIGRCSVDLADRNCVCLGVVSDSINELGRCMGDRIRRFRDSLIDCTPARRNRRRIGRCCCVRNVLRGICGGGRTIYDLGGGVDAGARRGDRDSSRCERGIRQIS